MTMNLNQLVESENFFDALRGRASEEVKENYPLPSPPQKADLHFGTAAYAVALLYDQGRERLLQLEKEGVVHSSTISGDSLGIATRCLTNYFIHQESGFNRYQYEQLARACYSAKQLLKKERG